MYTQQLISHTKQSIRLHQYSFALHAYNEMPLKDRKSLLKEHGHSEVYAHRSFSFLFKNIREDLIPSLNQVS